MVRALRELCVTLEVDHATLAGFNRLDKSIHAIATYPQQWQQLYVAQALHRHDPVLRMALQSHAVVQWADINCDAQEQALMSQAQTYGIGPNGVSLPLHGSNGDISVLSVSSTCPPDNWARHCARIIDQMQDYGIRMHAALIDAGYLRPVALEASEMAQQSLVRDEKKWAPVFLKNHATTNKTDQDDLSLKQHPDLGTMHGNAAQQIDADAQASPQVATTRDILDMAFVAGPAAPHPRRADLIDYCLAQIAAAQDAQSLDAALRLADAIFAKTLGAEGKSSRRTSPVK
ncbi:MAG: autoinducer binding domain-containing protein [Roseinatronobacter sp.]